MCVRILSARSHGATATATAISATKMGPDMGCLLDHTTWCDCDCDNKFIGLRHIGVTGCCRYDRTVEWVKASMVPSFCA